MKIQFNGYSVFYNSPNGGYNDARSNFKGDSNDWRTKWAYSPQKYEEFINNQDYDRAIKYLSMFKFDDIDKQKQLNNQIDELKRVGRIKSSMYNAIQDPNTLLNVKFADALDGSGKFAGLISDVNKLQPFSYNNAMPNFLEPGSGTMRTEPNGNVVDKFVTSMNRLASSADMKNVASRLSITFAPKVKKAFGLDWLDWADPDNANNIDNFIDRLGISYEDLQQHGVKIETEGGDRLNGSTTLTFDKSNPYAVKLLLALDASDSIVDSESMKPWGNTPVSIKGYDMNGKLIDTDYNNGIDLQTIRYMQSLANNAKQARNEALHIGDTGVRSYSSTVGPVINDELEQLKAMHDAGYIDDKEFNAQYNLVGADMFNRIRRIGPSNYRMYSNRYSDTGTDDLVEVNNEDRTKLQSYITSVLREKPKSVVFHSMVSDGEFGVLITIDAEDPSSDKSVDSKVDNRANTKETKIFIPGFMSEEVQAKINENTSTKAVNEINSMQDYGYAYDLEDGKSIKYNGDGTFNVKDSRGVIIDKVDNVTAEKYVNKAMIVKESVDNLIYQHMNSNGEIIDKQGYEQMARLIALNAANELYPELDMVGIDKTDYSESNIFDKHKYNINNTQYEMWKKLSEVFDIYDLVMEELTKYK